MLDEGDDSSEDLPELQRMRSTDISKGPLVVLKLVVLLNTNEEEGTSFAVLLAPPRDHAKRVLRCKGNDVRND
eukprot:COSAG01_NODE_677_length_14312_cov_10.195314_13_plen_73_part_00